MNQFRNYFYQKLRYQCLEAQKCSKIEWSLLVVAVRLAGAGWVGPSWSRVFPCSTFPRTSSLILWRRPRTMPSCTVNVQSIFFCQGNGKFPSFYSNCAVDDSLFQSLISVMPYDSLDEYRRNINILTLFVYKCHFNISCSNFQGKLNKVDNKKHLHFFWIGSKKVGEKENCLFLKYSRINDIMWSLFKAFIKVCLRYGLVSLVSLHRYLWYTDKITCKPDTCIHRMSLRFLISFKEFVCDARINLTEMPCTLLPLFSSQPPFLGTSSTKLCGYKLSWMSWCTR